MPGWIGLLGVLVVWTALLKDSNASWLRGKTSAAADTFVNMKSSHRICPAEQARCLCGEGADRRHTIINVDQCPYSTAWGSQCEPCTPAKELCQKLDKCARCSQDNPHAICAACPPDKHGLLCDKERPCKTPNVTEHTSIHPHFTRKGVYKLEFRCTGGRVRHGPKTIRCHSDRGTWNKAPPKCVLPMVCSALPSSPIPFTRVKPGSYTSERVVYECDVGYDTTSRVLETVLHCENGAWVQIGESVQCEPSPKCTSLPTYLGVQLQSGTTVKSIYHAGEKVHYECEDAFQPVHSQDANFTLVCVGSQWDGQEPQCELKGCKKLTLENGDVAYSGESITDYLPLNTTAHATCHKGYTLENLEPVKCSHTGHWQPSIPKCIPEACEDRHHGKMCPVAPVSDKVIPETNTSEIYPGETVTFKCKEDVYRRLGIGDTERICLHNGTLSGSEIVCGHVPQVCKIELPPGDSHLMYCRGNTCKQQGRDILQDKTFDFPKNVVPGFTRVEFWCDSDYYCLDGDHRVQCPYEGSVIKAPACKPACGNRNYPKKALIMGGETSTIEKWPWQAALMEVHRNQVEFLCGATLIDDKWAVTAAHCVMYENTTKLKSAEHLRLTYGLSSSQESMLQAVNSKKNKGKFNVVNIIPYDKYNGDLLHNDIALLELENRVEMSYYVGVACLPSGDEQLVGGEEGVVTGWGQTEMELLSPELRELPMQVVSTSECEKHYKDQGYNMEVMTDGMFCAMSNSTVKDTTDGDSGGPFVVQDDDDRWVLEGIVSWGASDSDKREVRRRAHVRLSKGSSLLRTCLGSACYGGYTRVSNYVQWIQEKTKGKITSVRCD